MPDSSSVVQTNECAATELDAVAAAFYAANDSICQSCRFSLRGTRMQRCSERGTVQRLGVCRRSARDHVAIPCGSSHGPSSSTTSGSMTSLRSGVVTHKRKPSRRAALHHVPSGASAMNAA